MSGGRFLFLFMNNKHTENELGCYDDCTGIYEAIMRIYITGVRFKY